MRAIEESDEARIEEAVLRLSRSRRAFSPLAFAIGAFALLFDGLRLLVSNWRLTLVQILPAMWIWLAMFDLKAHALHGNSFEVLRGAVLIPIILAIVAITVASFFLNAVFAFAITRPGAPEIRPAVAQARRHLTPILVSGAVVGLLLALSTTVVTRWGRPWFTLSLGIVIGMMMICYVAVPSRLIGVKPTHSTTRQAVDDGGRRRTGRDGLHTALHPRSPGHPDARIERSPDSRDRRARAGGHAAGRRNGSGQGHQDEHPPRRDAPLSRRVTSERVKPESSNLKFHAIRTMTARPAGRILRAWMQAPT